MAEAVLSVTLETLRDLLLEEARFLSGVEDQVEEIQVQLKMMKSFLKDADQIQLREEAVRRERVRTWVQEVKSLAYKTEDVLEMYAVEVASKKGKGKGVKDILKRFACILSEGKALHKVGKEIADIKSKINNLNTIREACGIRDLDAAESSREAKEKQRLRRQTFGHEVEEHFVGMKEDIRKLVSLLTDDKKENRVISICGMGGLGKTTLARKMFNHRVVRASFEAFAWVCITQECHIPEVLQDILKQITRLYETLQKGKCLVVLDDIWKIEDWEILSHAFPIIEGNSKVLLTTRSEEVAKIGFLYKPSILTKDEGWELLQRMTIAEINKKDHKVDSEFEVVGKEIVHKCGYLPLAISVLGGILRTKKSIGEWKMVMEDINLYLRKVKGNKEAVHNVLALSYDQLPYYLKPCFLYLGRYRADKTIYMNDLYLLWIAEELVLSEYQEEKETMRDVAESYLKELASRCMVDVQMDDFSIVPTVKSCQLHDLMRDLCLAKGKEENFYKIIDYNPELPIMDLSNEGRRLDLYLHKDLDLNTSTPESRTHTKLFEKVKGQYLRTLYVRHADYSRYDLLEDICYLKKFKLLRVLALVGCEFELPSAICQLIHLRYLSLARSKVKELPSSISNLPFLQTLNLDINWATDIYLPNIFWKMKRLKVIYLPYTYHASETLQFNDLEELEALSWVKYLGDETINLSGLVNLRYFSGKFGHTHALSQMIDQIHSCRKVKCIDILIKKELVGPSLAGEQGSALLKKIFLCENLNDLTIGSSIGTFPPYEPQFCRKLTQLTLVDTEIEEDPMQFLGKLPKLRRLQLMSKAFIGKKMICDEMAFPQLRNLWFSGLPNLEEWRVDKGALPNLSDLMIGECPKLERIITDGLDISALKMFDIWDVSHKEKYRELHKQEKKKFAELQLQND